MKQIYTLKLSRCNALPSRDVYNKVFIIDLQLTFDTLLLSHEN
jgi:hypothetical protein